MIGQTAPTSDVDRFTQTLASLERRIADLERAAARAVIVVHSGAFTPTLTNMAIGTGGSAANVAHYTYVGDDPGEGLLVVTGFVCFGTSGTTLPGNPIKVSLPAGYTITNLDSALGSGTDFSVGWWSARQGGLSLWMQIWGTDAGAVRFIAGNVAGTYGENATATSATVPFTWAAGDSINYEYVVRATKA